MCRIVWWERLREGKGAIPLLHGPRGQKILRRALNRSLKYKKLEYCFETFHIQKILEHISGTKTTELSFTNSPNYVMSMKQKAETLRFWDAHLEQGPDNDP